MTSQVFEEQLTSSTTHPTLIQFQQIVKRYFLIHLLFFTISSLLLVLFISCTALFQHSFFIGMLLALFFFSLVMYFIIKTYVKEQKPHELITLCNKHMAAIIKTTKEPKILAQEAHAMAKRFDNVAHLLYASKPHMQFLEQLFRPFSTCCFWQDVHQIKEFFLLVMIDELKNCVKTHPTTPLAHQDLALGYLTLFSHYNEPLEPSKGKLAGLEAVRHVLEKKRAFAADSAVEECLILREYTPEDPWVYKHLAPIYHDLQRYDKEIEAYEALVSLQLDDFEALYTLGTLYFAQGMNAKGLKVYEQMQLHDPKQAQKLISMYGAYLPYDPYKTL